MILLELDLRGWFWLWVAVGSTLVLLGAAGDALRHELRMRRPLR